MRSEIFKLFTVIFILSLSGIDTIHAQYISWQQVLEIETTEPDYRIYYGPDSLQHADLWLPDGDGPHPVVVMVHGGCWLSNLPGTELMNPAAEALKNAGFAVWNIEYRRLGHDGGGYPGTFTDVADGADHLRNIADHFKLDLTRIVATGHSAGGHLATWLGARPNIPEKSPLYSNNPLKIHGVAALAPINDLNYYNRIGLNICGENTVIRLVNASSRENPYSDTSPASLLPLGIPQILVVGAFDGPVPPFVNLNYIRDAKEAGDDVEVILHADAAHFEMTVPGTSQWDDVLKAITRLLNTENQ
jgi:acetyl esterase/lipase